MSAGPQLPREERFVDIAAADLLYETGEVYPYVNDDGKTAGTASYAPEGEEGFEMSEEANSDEGPSRGWPFLSEFPRWYGRRLIGFDQSLNVYGFQPHYDQLIALLFTCTALVVLGLIQYYVFTPLIDGSLNIFLPAFGATCTCLFAVPKIPISQPRNVLIAHVSAGVIGISFVNLLRYAPEHPYNQNIAGALGVGVHQVFMVFTNTLHPPASATVVSAVQASFQSYFMDRGFIFCVTPCITGSVVVIVMAILLNNLVPSRSPYPQYW